MEVSAQVEALEASAAAHEAEREASFQRCDTDGFMSQWASGLCAQKDRAEARLLEAEGLAEFPALFDLQGQWVPARLIDGKFGPCWMVLDHKGEFKGEFVGAFPKQEATLAKKGYCEGVVMRPARVDFVGSSAVNVRVAYLAVDEPWEQPAVIISSNRWKEDQ